MSTQIDGKMVIGACGVCCNVCRLYIAQVCAGCATGDDQPIEQVLETACPILRCATAKKIPFCIRDCPEYPCVLYDHGSPLCEKFLREEERSLPDHTILDRARFGLRLTRQEKDSSLEKGIPRLYIYCLGSFRVYLNEKPITETEWGQVKGATHKIKALFAYLLAKGSTGATKDELKELLWGDQPDSDSKLESRLHATVYYLRRALEPDLPPRTKSRYVFYHAGHYSLAPSNGYWLDAAAFEDYYQYASRLEDGGLVDIAARYWKLAEALYQGDYMVDLEPHYTEDYLDDCCSWRRFRLKGMYLVTLLKLAHFHFQSKQDRLSFMYAQKAVTEDSCYEEAHRLIMRLKSRSGQRAEVLHQYRLCERALAEVENRSPSPQTTEALRELSKIS